MKRYMTAVTLAVLAAAFPAAAGAAPMSLAPKAAVYSDEKDAPLKNPEGVACAGDTVIFADTGNGRLVRCSYDGSAVKPGAEIRLPQLPYPVRVQIGSNGEIFVLDGRLKKVARLSPAGEFNGYVEPKGLVSQRPISPSGFRLDAKDDVYLSDISSGRVLVLDPAGNLVKAVDFPRGAGFISDLYVDAKGALYILDAQNARVYSMGADQKEFEPLTKDLKDYASYPVSMAMDERGFIYLVDSHGGGVVIVGQDGSFQGRQLALGWGEGQLYYPIQMCISPKGAAFIADRGNSRVDVFSIMRQ